MVQLERVPRRFDDVVREWRERVRFFPVGLVEADDGSVRPNPQHLALVEGDLAADLAEAGATGSASIKAEVVPGVGRPTFVRLRLVVYGEPA